ncbi:hypothetical protein [Jeongeupia naejangsanensis]|uniref:Uncharacterized protein n=1 Tax=Jeongeupia naejangsanensis TaxID=613195 RepID=A0ABS2BHG8_9NEIS|nr:hypothetical protein [Jeongeupia naejangsanensis]MBM3114533.1 hypothetical protein [Jeongeupia naejangsanensis]
MKFAPVVLSAFALLASQASLADSTVRLLCQGSGTVTENQSSVGTELGGKDNDHSKMTVTNTSGHRTFSGAATVEINGNAVRFQIPQEMLPGLNNAHEGWLTMDQPFVGEKEITGVLALNFLNKPKVRIDRTTGLLTLNGGYSSFSGACTKVDADAKPKF